mmetsp:Transcript_111532/g.315440  ORF Transcript_111532/g.315440 Transcript_111532/m.315440 type:complete len:448 (-) Transcript_111532:404-1747(-)
MVCHQTTRAQVAIESGVIPTVCHASVPLQGRRKGHASQLCTPPIKKKWTGQVPVHTPDGFSREGLAETFIHPLRDGAQAPGYWADGVAVLHDDCTPACKELEPANDKGLLPSRDPDDGLQLKYMKILLPLAPECPPQNTPLTLKSQHSSCVRKQVGPGCHTDVVIHGPLQQCLGACANPPCAIGHSEHPPIVGLQGQPILKSRSAFQRIPLARLFLELVGHGHAGPVDAHVLDLEDLLVPGPPRVRIPPGPLALHARHCGGPPAVCRWTCPPPEPAVAAFHLQRPHSPDAVVGDHNAHCEPALCPQPANPHRGLCEHQAPTDVIAQALFWLQLRWQDYPGGWLHVNSVDALSADKTAHATPWLHLPDCHRLILALCLHGVDDCLHSHQSQCVRVQRTLDALEQELQDKTANVYEVHPRAAEHAHCGRRSQGQGLHEGTVGEHRVVHQ